MNSHNIEQVNFTQAHHIDISLVCTLHHGPFCFSRRPSSAWSAPGSAWAGWRTSSGRRCSRRPRKSRTRLSLPPSSRTGPSSAGRGVFHERREMCQIINSGEKIEKEFLAQLIAKCKHFLCYFERRAGPKFFDAIIQKLFTIDYVDYFPDFCRHSNRNLPAVCHITTIIFYPFKLFYIIQVVIDNIIYHELV